MGLYEDTMLKMSCPFMVDKDRCFSAVEGQPFSHSHENPGFEWNSDRSCSCWRLLVRTSSRSEDESFLAVHSLGSQRENGDGRHEENEIVELRHRIRRQTQTAFDVNTILRRSLSRRSLLPPYAPRQTTASGWGGLRAVINVSWDAHGVLFRAIPCSPASQ